MALTLSRMALARHRFQELRGFPKEPAASAVPLTAYGSKVSGIGLTPTV